VLNKIIYLKYLYKNTIISCPEQVLAIENSARNHAKKHYWKNGHRGRNTFDELAQQHLYHIYAPDNMKRKVVR